MSSIRITINGKDALVGKLQQRLATFTAKVDNAIQGAGIDTEAVAKQLAPVDTGRLRASIKYTKMALMAAQVGTNVNYARFQEFGTHKMRARPFLFPAYIRAKQALLDELKALIF